MNPVRNKASYLLTGAQIDTMIKTALSETNNNWKLTSDF